MKNKMMKNCGYAFVIGMMLFGLPACNDDDDNENDESKSGTPAQQPPQVNGAGIQYPVTSVTAYGTTWTYEYADGRMTGGKTNGGFVFSLSSNPLVIQTGYPDDVYTYSNIRVNESGFITYAEMTNIYEGEVYATGSATCRYDTEGHLVYEKGNFRDADGYTESYTTVYTWQNGNLMQIETTDTYEGEGERHTDIYTVEYAYDTSKWQNPGVYAHCDEEEGLSWFFEAPLFYYAGLLGRSTQNIPTNMTLTEHSEGEEDYVYSTTFNDVTYNDDGSIQSIGFPYNAFYYGYGDENTSMEKRNTLPNGFCIPTKDANEKTKARILLKKHLRSNNHPLPNSSKETGTID